MILLVDIGNARAKWGLWNGGQLHSMAQQLHRGRSDVAVSRLIKATTALSPKAILVSNVAGQRFSDRLKHSCLQHWGIEPILVRVTDNALGVSCGYREVHRLGVDRWIAMLAAFADGGPVCVVDAGTAMTIDGVDGAGQHLGGVIVPGFRLMAKSLDSDTSDIGLIASQLAGEAGELFGRSTAEGVIKGARLALVGAIETVHKHLTEQLGKAPRLVLTGGDAGELASTLQLFFCSGGESQGTVRLANDKTKRAFQFWL